MGQCEVKSGIWMELTSDIIQDQHMGDVKNIPEMQLLTDCVWEYQKCIVGYALTKPIEQEPKEGEKHKEYLFYHLKSRCCGLSMP